MIFSQPAFLWGLLAVVVPIIVHLLSLRRYRKVYFSNVERLTEMQSRQRRHSRLREWLILACRVLAVAFLVLAFAQPVIPRRQAEVRSGSTAVSIYIDNSFSMEQATADGSVLDQAKHKAREVVEAYSLGDRFQLLSNEMSGLQMRLLSRDEVLEAIEEVHPSAASPMLGAVVRRQHDFLRQAQVANRHAYLISDFQTSMADVESLPPDSLVLTTVIPLEGVGVDNVYVDTLRLDAPAYFVGGHVNVEVAVRNSGSRDVDQVPVRLLVEGRERAIATVDLPAGGSAVAHLHFSLDHAGYVDGMVSVDDYPVTFDDHQYFTLRVDNATTVLEVDGSTPNEHIKRLFSTDSTARLVASSHLQLGEADLLILNEYASLTSGEVQQIQQWVEQGGSLLVVPPAEGKAEGLNPLLASMQAPQLGQWSPRQAKASAVDYDAALYRGVFSTRSDDMEMPVVKGHYHYAKAPHGGQPLISLADGTPLLSVTHAGSGLVYLFSAPLRADCNSLVQQALFVPTLYNMALYSKQLAPPYYVLGSHDAIALQEQHIEQRQPYEMYGPDGFAFIPDVRRVGDRWWLHLHDELESDGIFSYDGEHLAVNYSRRESQMDFLSVADLKKAFDGRRGYTLVENSGRPLSDELRSRDGGRPLWRLMVVLSLLMLACEILLIKLKR